MELPPVELVGLRQGNCKVDYWIRIPLSEEVLYEFWKKPEQPDLKDLENRIQMCVREWLEAANG